jgi:hypothetical protein
MDGVPKMKVNNSNIILCGLEHGSFLRPIQGELLFVLFEVEQSSALASKIFC